MLVRKARAARNWREFFFEVGTIVIGVAVALGGQRVGEAVNWHRQVHEAETTMHVELSLGARLAYGRMAAEPCIKAELDAIGQALAANRDNGAPVPVMTYVIPRFAWPTEAWESARALQVPGHMSPQKWLAYARAYFFQGLFSTAAEQEDQIAARLETLRVNAGQLQPAERDRLFLALQEERRVDALFGRAGQFLMALKALNVSVAEDQKQAVLNGQPLLALAKQYPGCLKAPEENNAR